MVDFNSKSDIVTAALRELIITGELAPGVDLKQRDIAERFSVSATPVREAFRRLQAEGLITHDLHRGFTVAETDYEFGEENFEIRAALEGLAVRLAAERLSAADLAEITALHEALAALPDGDPGARALNRDFHFRIYEASHSPTLMALLRLLWQSFPAGPPVRRSLEESIAQHAEIVDALRASDGARAERAVSEHIRSARASLEGPPGTSATGRSDLVESAP